MSDAPDPLVESRRLRRENRAAAERIRAHRLAAVERREARHRDLREQLAVDWIAPYIDALNILRGTGDPIVGGPTSVWMRKYGKNWPIFQTEQELALFRAPARTLLATNGYAQGLVEGLTSYVLGTGCTYRVAAKKGKDLPKEAITAAQQVVDDTLERNEWFGGQCPGMEQELFQRSLEDGEWILAHFPQDDGYCEMRVIEPEALTQMPGTDVREYGFGVRTKIDDPQKPLGYYIQYGDSPTEGDEHGADDVTHMRCNVKRGMKRGITDFCFDTYDTLYLAGRLRTALADTAAQQASIVGVRQHDNATQEDVQSFVDQDADYTNPDYLTGQQRDVKVKRRGQWEDIPKGQNYVAGPIATSSPIHIQVLDACLRGAGCRWNAPPWLMSGDLNAMNYATSLTAESPFVKTVQRRQGVYTRAFRRPVWYALKHYVQTNGLRDQTGRVWQWEELADAIDLVVTAPSPETRNKLEETQRAAIEIPLGVQSPQGYMQEQGRDADQVEADNQAWKDKFGPQQPGLPDQPPPDDGTDGFGGGAQAPAPVELPRPESILENFTGEDANGHHWVNGKQVAAPKKPAAAAPTTGGPVPVDALKKKPGADKKHLAALAAAETDPVAKDYFETAEWNLPEPTDDAIAVADSIYDKTFPTDHEARRFLTVSQLKMQQAAAAKKGHADVAEKLGRAASAFGPTRGVAEALDDLVTAAVTRVLLEHGFTGTDRHNHKWVDGKQVKSAPASGATKPQAAAPAVPDEHAAVLRDDVARSVPPAVAKAPGVVAKLQDAALTVAARAWIKLNELSPAAMRIAAALGDVVDTPADMAKFGFNPTSGGGQGNAAVANNDFVRMNLEDTFGVGISGHLAASIASKVLVRVAAYAKSRISGTRTESEQDGLAEVADIVAGVLADTSAVLGLDGAPGAEEIAAALAEAMKAK